MNDGGFQKIKKLMSVVGGKVIVVEDGEPIFVISSVSDFLGSERKEFGNSEIELIEKINQDILEWKNRQRERELSQMEKNLSSDIEKMAQKANFFPEDRI